MSREVSVTEHILEISKIPRNPGGTENAQTVPTRLFFLHPCMTACMEAMLLRHKDQQQHYIWFTMIKLITMTSCSLLTYSIPRSVTLTGVGSRYQTQY